MKKSLFNCFFVPDLAIDMTSGNIMIYQQGSQTDNSIRVNEPAVVIADESDCCVAVGQNALKLKGVYPDEVSFVEIIRGGSIAHPEFCEQFIRNYINEIYKNERWWKFSPDVLAVIPQSATQTHQKIITETLDAAGAKSIDLITSLIAASRGIPEHTDPTKASVIAHIGRDYTEIGIIALNKIHYYATEPVGYDDFIKSICNYIRVNTDYTIGEVHAEKLLGEIGTAYYNEETDDNQYREVSVMLKRTSVPEVIRITKRQIFEALSPVTERIMSVLLDVLENTKEDMAADLQEHGIFIVGNGGKVSGIDLAIGTIGIKTRVAENFMTSIVDGAGKIQRELNSI
ncbi:rod shape-determining protein [Photobacterium damselae]|uniref:rod shape-determining protein n=1 Tax=Photobacterium damselae TaxID=38293 RepID=UPI001F41362D|nr:rod shape-determining protein [Photobacterium damselae]UKA04577.1 rod shape-determining protein [Photobacterium damselae subsp. damselae]